MYSKQGQLMSSLSTVTFEASKAITNKFLQTKKYFGTLVSIYMILLRSGSTKGKHVIGFLRY